MLLVGKLKHHLYSGLKQLNLLLSLLPLLVAFIILWLILQLQRAFSQMNLQHTKTRNRLEPHRVEKLLYIQINKRQFRADPPPIITPEILLDEEDEEIERILQRKHIQDYLSDASDSIDSLNSADSAVNFASIPAVISVLNSVLNSSTAPIIPPNPTANSIANPTTIPTANPPTITSGIGINGGIGVGSHNKSEAPI